MTVDNRYIRQTYK